MNKMMFLLSFTIQQTKF